MRPFNPNMNDREIALYVAASTSHGQSAAQVVTNAQAFHAFLTGSAPKAAQPVEEPASNGADTISPAQRARTEQVKVTDEEAEALSKRRFTPAQLFGTEPLIGVLRDRDLVARLSMVGINTTASLMVNTPIALGMAQDQDQEIHLMETIVQIASKSIDKLPEEVRNGSVGQKIKLMVGSMNTLMKLRAAAGGCPGCEHCMPGDEETPAEVQAIVSMFEEKFGPGSVKAVRIDVEEGAGIEDIIRLMASRAAL